MADKGRKVIGVAFIADGHFVIAPDIGDEVFTLAAHGVDDVLCSVSEFLQKNLIVGSAEKILFFKELFSDFRKVL